MFRRKSLREDMWAFIVAFANDAIGVIIRRSVSIFLELTVGGTTWRF